MYEIMNEGPIHNTPQNQASKNQGSDIFQPPR